MRLVIAVVLAISATASAGDLTKEECLDAHSKGQDAKEAGKLSLARKLFLTCAQSSCPQLVQGDCARFADDLSRLQPTVSLAARDSDGTDLPDTTVYIDGELVATRIDGEPHDVDPGNHVFKFSNGGREQAVTVVVGSGEKGRTVVGTFPAPQKAAPVVTGTAALPRDTEKTTHAPFAKYVIIGGGALTAVGAALTAYGYTRIPSGCSLSTHQCAAPPGDPTFDKASSAAKNMDLGLIAGTAGLAAVVAGVGWYVASAHTSKETQVVVTPTSVGFQASF
jgi:hypothetical protein